MIETTERMIATDAGDVFVSIAGAGPPLLLLHGFPQTHLMWRDLVPEVARALTVVCADLPGFGASTCPAVQPDDAPPSKRAFAGQMVQVMEALGHKRFAVAGHDRGARVAYRLALDWSDRVTRLGVFDVLPIGEVWDRANADFALGYWPWTFLAQPGPLPETMLASHADKIVESALGGWGTPRSIFSDEIRDAYVAALRDPDTARSICEEYRAAAGIDRTHDAEDRMTGRHIRCPTLVLWAQGGPLDSWYQAEGGPLAIWRRWASNASGYAVAGGHFFPEAAPAVTATAMSKFFSAAEG